MPLSDEQINAIAGPADYWDRRVFALAIESAATAPLLAQIAALEADKAYQKELGNLQHRLMVSGEQRGIAKATEEFSGKVAQLEAQLAEARKDAERYRWLQANYARGDGYDRIDSALNAGEGDTQLSPAIDAAIAQESNRGPI